VSQRADIERTPVLNLGAGVQSSVLLLMACSGELEERGWARPEVAVFADTQDEPADVMEWLPLLRMEAHRAGIPLVEGTAGDLRQDVIDTASGRRHRMSNPPVFVRDEHGKPQMIPRGCTRDYKLRVIRGELRKLGYGERRPVVSYLGLTTDEVERMKPSDVAWQSLDWPLIHMGMSRHDCELWLERNGYPVAPKSACRMCPMRSDAAWREMKVRRPDDFAAAVEVDHAIRTGLPGLKGAAFLHRSLVPLDQVDFRNAEDRGQLSLCETSGCFT
jgi:hypothetical protein